MVVIERQNKPSVPSEEDIAVSTESSRILSSYLNACSATQKIKLDIKNGQEELVEIPSVAYELLIEILAQMSRGNGVTIVPVSAELTTQQAANLLNVSRPHLIKLLNSGEIPHHKVGTHRRILAKDLYDYKERIDNKRSQSLDELTALTEELELYED